MVAGALAFSLMSALVKLVGSRLPVMEVVLARALVTTALSYGALRRRGVDPRGVDRRGLVLRGLLGFGALTGFFTALVHLPLADATVIHYTSPVFTALFAVPLLGERMRRADIGPALLGLAGVAVVARPSALLGGAGLPVVGVAAGLAGAVFSGAAYTTVRRLTRTEDPLVIVFYFSWISVVGALVPALRNWVPPTAGEVAALVVIGLVTQAGQVLITWGLRAERAGRAASAGYLQIVFAAGWGALLFGQLPDAWTLAGAALVVVATLTMARAGRPAGPAAPGGGPPPPRSA